MQNQELKMQGQMILNKKKKFGNSPSLINNQ